MPRIVGLQKIGDKIGIILEPFVGDSGSISVYSDVELFQLKTDWKRMGAEEERERLIGQELEKEAYKLLNEKVEVLTGFLKRYAALADDISQVSYDANGHVDD